MGKHKYHSEMRKELYVGKSQSSCPHCQTKTDIIAERERGILFLKCPQCPSLWCASKPDYAVAERKFLVSVKRLSQDKLIKGDGVTLHILGEVLSNYTGLDLHVKL